MERPLFAGRERALQYLRGYLETSKLSERNEITVAVVGGTRDEPELKILDEYGIKYKTYVLNIAGECDIRIDLNCTNKELPDIKFDLVLCSQVLEHVWNIANAALILKGLAKSDGYVFVNVPFSNMVHRDEISDFYSAGYNSSFLCHVFENIGMEVIDSRNFGTRRLYNSIHYLQIWLFGKELERPYLFSKRRATKHRLLRMILDIRLTLFLFSWSNKWIENGQFSSESIIFIRRT